MLLATLLAILLQNPQVAEAASYIFTAPSSVAAYAEYEAQARGLDPTPLLKTLDCESHFVWNKVGDNGDSYGVAQIDLKYHPTITKEEALNPEWAIDWTISEFQKDNAHWWTCWRALQK